MTLWTIAGVSGTSAMIVPPETQSPGLYGDMCVCHFFSVSRESTLTPRLMYVPDDLRNLT